MERCFAAGTDESGVQVAVRRNAAKSATLANLSALYYLFQTKIGGLGWLFVPKAGDPVGKRGA